MEKFVNYIQSKLGSKHGFKPSLLFLFAYIRKLPKNVIIDITL